jgi:hypothetical protein
MAEIDLQLAAVENSGSSDIAPADVQLSSQPVSKLGDIWILGSHRTVCADALIRGCRQEIRASTSIPDRSGVRGRPQPVLQIRFAEPPAMQHHAGLAEDVADILKRVRLKEHEVRGVSWAHGSSVG